MIRANSEIGNGAVTVQIRARGALKISRPLTIIAKRQPGKGIDNVTNPNRVSLR